MIHKIHKIHKKSRRFITKRNKSRVGGEIRSTSFLSNPIFTFTYTTPTTPITTTYKIEKTPWNFRRNKHL